MKIAEDILKILAECRIENNTLFLPPEQLDRKTYVAVNKCLENIGGKWNRKAKGHVFDDDPTEAFDNLIITGETEDMKKTFQFFPTPRAVAEIVCDMAELKQSSRVLEPSAGKGDLADAIFERSKTVYCYEINKKMCRDLDEKPYTLLACCDFLVVKPTEQQPFDRVVMNPPFSRQQDIDHICHAYEFLKSGGILVSLISLAPFFRMNEKSVKFREWLEEHNAETIDVPAGAFKESGTMIPTKIVKIKKR